jgi:hypothetical protein
MDAEWKNSLISEVMDSRDLPVTESRIGYFF